MFKPYQRAELHFDLVKEIGFDGANSRTFISKDHQLDAEIVIKQISKSNLSPTTFFDESKALYASAHANFVQIHYACQDNDCIYIAMPYYRKGSVKELITGKFMTVREIVVISCQVLSGLHNIHSKKLIHFDIKPDNILLSDRGEALLSDFGLAKPTASGIAGQDRHYLMMKPPEAFSTNYFTKAFDIYQFGLTLYRMCVGNEAFYAMLAPYGDAANFDRAAFKFDVVNGRFPDRKSLPPHIPSKLRTVIRTCLKTDPKDRYDSAISIANAMADIDGKLLDWKLANTATGRVWTRNESGTKYELSVDLAGVSQFTKSVGGSVPKRVTAGCSPSITDKEIGTLLGSY